MRKIKRKPIYFMGRSQKDLQNFPKTVKQCIGFDLDEVQCGRTPANAKKLKGIQGVMELVECYDKDTYRAMYITTIRDSIYVLHCFKKKSKSGIKTPKQDIDLVKQRLKEAKSLNKKE